MEADIIMMENQSKEKVCNLKSWPNAESHAESLWKTTIVS